MAEAEKQPESKSVDFWRKLEVLGKIFSGVVLVVITLIINSGVNEIQNALQKGKLIESLIDDLTQEQSQMRRDIALIALNRVVEDKDSLLIIEIAERMLLNMSDRPEAIGVARDIIKERSPARAEAITDQLIDELAKSMRDSTLSPADTSAPPPQVSERTFDIRSAAIPRVVFIQFRGSLARSKIDELRALLKKVDIPSPRAQRLDSDYNNSIRYFHEEDEELAQLVDSVATAFFEEKDCSIGDIPVDNLESKGFRVPRGQVELWIQGSCSD